MESLMTDKPPVGIAPESLWNEQRMWDIIAAIERYRNAGQNIPGEWIVELWRIIPYTKCFTADGIGRYVRTIVKEGEDAVTQG
jgi:hypothetical protein